MNLQVLEPKTVTNTVNNFQIEITEEQKITLSWGLVSYVEYCRDQIKEGEQLLYHAQEIEKAIEMVKVLAPDLLSAVEEE
jgi:hypothetical protein